MKINLPNNLINYDKIIYEPFCIFEKKNFLEKKIKENFSDIQYIDSDIDYI